MVTSDADRPGGSVNGMADRHFGAPRTLGLPGYNTVTPLEGRQLQRSPAAGPGVKSLEVTHASETVDPRKSASLLPSSPSRQWIRLVCIAVLLSAYWTIPASSSLVIAACVFYATADEADAYMFYRCFFWFLFLFFLFVFFLFFFLSATKYETTVLGNGWWIFMKLLPNDSGENGVSIAVSKWGLGPRLIFVGAKNYTVRAFACTYWCRRLANDSELLYGGSVLYGGCVKKAWASECI